MYKQLISQSMKTIIFASLILLSACNLNKSNALLEVGDFKAKVLEPNAQILDIRTDVEFKKAHIANAVNISFTSANFDAMATQLYPDVPTYIYSNTEAEAVAAAQKLNSFNFKELFVLKGGIASWQSANLPLEAEQPKKVYESDTIPFEEARKGNKLVMVDFNATWCKPCKMIEPFVHKLHDNRASEVIVYSIDTDQRPDLAREYNANQIPLLVFIKNNQEVYRSLGAISEEELNAMVDKYK